jgi:hypothetical protein
MLPANIGIDLDTNATYGNSVALNSDGSLDILFAPSGNVIGSQAGTDKLILWVRDYTIDITKGEPSLIVVYTRSGWIASVPVDPSNGFVAPTATPYRFTASP